MGLITTIGPTNFQNYTQICFFFEHETIHNQNYFSPGFISRSIIIACSHPFIIFTLSNLDQTKNLLSLNRNGCFDETQPSQQLHHRSHSHSRLPYLTIIIINIVESRNKSISTKTETYLNGDESPHQLVYIKKHILNPRQRDQHRRLRYNHHYYYYRHSIRRRGLRHRANYFKMMTKKNSNGFNRPVRPDTFSAMLPKGFVPPSGSSPCHNQNPNSATTLFCDLSTQP
ncbi:hypothetical protein Bca52824_089767 [Brassica carinata]|uniref:Uncharacterized protein n=1 Tax=Brassica carinata TaxID=52824 RepID=A0A8X7TEP0_BRACI|nr:hypothetical protein Bca52824_089767 [Brassica carinata]